MNEPTETTPRCRILAAFQFSLLGALTFGFFDFLIATRFSEIELRSIDRVWLLSFGLGRHVAQGLALGLIATIILLVPTRKGFVDPRLWIGTIIVGAFLVFYNESLTTGARISTRSYAKYILVGTRVGGPIVALAFMLILRSGVCRLWQRRARPLSRIVLSLAMLGAAFAAAYVNIRVQPGRYPDIHAQVAAAALLLAAGASFCLLSARPIDGTSGMRPWYCIGFAALVLAGALLSQRASGFQRLRGTAPMFARGVEPQEWFVGRIFSYFEPKIQLRTIKVDDLLHGLAEVDKIDFSRRLDEAIPNRRELNVLLIALDTLRADRAGFNGYLKNATTPNIDKLASGGFVFSSFYTNYPTSNYAYASLLTGLYPGSTPLHGHRTYQRWQFPDDRVNYPRLFARSGIQSLGSTAFGLAERENPRYFGMLDDGFDVFNPEQPQGTIPAAWVTDTFLTLIDRRNTQRYFGFVHYMEPHDPYETWPKFNFGHDAQSRYDSDIAKADDEVGRLIAGLKRRNLWDSTIVAVFSDHGEAFGEHGTDKHDSSLFDEQIRVPLVIRIPGLSGRKVDAAASLVDLLPTLTRLIGVDDGVERHGRSLLPYMFGSDDLPERVVFAQKWFTRSSLALQEIRCVVHDRLKLIETEKEPNSDFLMFDLVADPKELKNLFGDPAYADRQAKLVSILRAKVQETFERVGMQLEDAPRKAMEREVEALAKVVEESDAKAAFEALKSLCNRFLSRYDEIDLAAKSLPSTLQERVRKAVFKRAIEVYPKSVYQISKLLKVLPHPEHVPYYRRLMNDAAASLSARLEATFALAEMGEAEVLPYLKQAASNTELTERFEVAMALANLGDASLLREFVPVLRSDCTWDTAPLLRGMAAAKDPCGADVLLDRLSYAEIFDFNTKRLIAHYAAVVDTPETERICFLLGEETDSELSGPAVRALTRRLGSLAAFERRRVDFRVELQGTAALNNGKLELVESILADYIVKNPGASPRSLLELGRARMLRGNLEGAKAIFAEMSRVADARYRRAAERQASFIEKTKWFYAPEELACSWRLIAKPRVTRRNRCYLVEIELKNESGTYWHGGQWTYGVTVRSSIVGADGKPLAVDDRGTNIRQSEVLNFLPLEGVAPGETVRVTVVGRAPAGYWKGRIAVWLEQRAGGKTAKNVFVIDEAYNAQ